MGAMDRPWRLRGAVIGLALVVGVVSWLSTRDDDEPPAPAAAETRIVDERDLGNLAKLTGTPVYWAGPVRGTNLEVTEDADGSVQVRYLEEGTEAGGGLGGALTVATYPLADPAAALETFAAEPGTTVHRGRDGRKVVVGAENPTSAYFASPDNTVQVEVYDPSPKRALRLALSSRVRPAV
ncbi:MAG TPA: hypothetical protein VHF50_06395 [Solirubrobacterales bacterium]|nr:hypothetical protein [Solirubrobacterales bacterium]